MINEDMSYELNGITEQLKASTKAINTLNATDDTIFTIVAMQEHIIKRLDRLSEIIKGDTDSNYHWIDSKGDMVRIVML